MPTNQELLDDLLAKVNGSDTDTYAPEFEAWAAALSAAQDASGAALQLADTIADLKALTASASAARPTCLVRGYATAGDGGGGVFRWDAASSGTDNGGTVIALTAGGTGRWLRIHAGEIEAEWFGATGDGTADDTAEIQAMLDAAAGGTALLRPGKTYVVSGVTIAAGTTLDGRGATLKLKASSTGHVLSGSSADGATVRAVTVDGNTDNCPAAGSGIYFVTSDDVTVERVKVLDTTQSGVYLYDCTRSSVFGSTVTDTGQTGIYAYGTGLRVTECTVKTSGGANITYEGSGIVIADNECEAGGPSGDNITGYAAGTEIVTITGNACRGSLNHGIHAGGGPTAITGNTIYSPAQSGIRFESHDGSTATDVTVTGNTIHTAAGDGVHLALVDGGAVNGNTVQAAGGNGLNLRVVNGVAIGANTVTGCTSHGMRLAGAMDCAIGFNALTGNGGDGVSLLDDGAVTSLRNVLVGNRATGNTVYGIRETGGSDYNTFAANVLTGNTGGTILTAGANSAVLSVDAAGLVAPLAFLFAGDTDTGMARLTANVLALQAGGTNRVRVGTSSITLGDSALNPFNFNFRVNSFNETAWDSLSGVYQYFRRCGTSINAPAASAADQLISSLEFQGHTGSAYMTGAKIEAIVYDTPGVGIMPMSIVFSTAGASGAAVERLRIKPQGQISLKPLAADPSNAADGDLYYNSSTGKFRGRAAGAWVDLH